MRKIETGGFLPVMPLSIVATKGSDGKLNFAPHGQIATVTTKPSVLSIAVRKGGKTGQNILQTGRLSINIPSAKMAEHIKLAGSTSGKRENKGELFSVFYGADGTPMVRDALFSFHCKVIQTTEVYDTYVFLLEVLEAYAQESCVAEDGTPLVEGTDLLLCAINGKYYEIGRPH